MKKARIIILFITVVALFACLFFLLKDDGKINEEEESKEEYIAVKTVNEELKEIRLTNTSGVFGFEKKNGEWMNIFTESVKTSGNTIYGIESIIKQTFAIDAIEKDVASMEKYGLDRPSATAKYVTESGKNGFLKIGNSIVGTKYYFTVDDKDVYTMDMAEAGLFLVGMRAFADMTLINEDATSFKRIVISNYGEDIAVARKSEEELKREDADALFSFGLESPVKENASPNDIQKLCEAMGNIGAAEYDPYADDEECGFVESERYFTYETDKSGGKFIIGNSPEEGYSFVKAEGVKGAYKVSNDAISFMDYTAFDLVDKHIALFYFDDISKITIEKGEEKYEIFIGDEVIVNGKTVDTEIAQDFYRSLISLTYEGNVEKELEETSGEVTISFETKREKDVTNYINYDAMYYAVSRNGATEFIIQKKYVEKILSLVKEL